MKIKDYMNKLLIRKIKSVCWIECLRLGGMLLLHSQLFGIALLEIHIQFHALLLLIHRIMNVKWNE